MEGQCPSSQDWRVFQMWNNSKSPIRYMWGKLSHCHIIEVEPCAGVIGSSPVACLGLDAGTPVQGPGCPVVKSSLGLVGNCPHPTPLISTSMSAFSPEPNEVGDFELNLTGGVPGPTSQDLECEIKDSPYPVVLHIEASFKVLWVGANRAAGNAWRGWEREVNQDPASSQAGSDTPLSCSRDLLWSSMSQPFSSVCFAWERRLPSPFRSGMSASCPLCGI